MPVNGRQAADDSLVVALAKGATKEDAAVQAGVSIRTVFRRLDSAEFRRRVEQARGAMIEAGVGKLANLTSKAADVLDKPLDSEDEKNRLAAARTVLEYASKGTETAVILRRLDEVERLLAERGRNDAETAPRHCPVWAVGFESAPKAGPRAGALFGVAELLPARGTAGLCAAADLTGER